MIQIKGINEMRDRELLKLFNSGLIPPGAVLEVLGDINDQDSRIITPVGTFSKRDFNRIHQAYLSTQVTREHTHGKLHMVHAAPREVPRPETPTVIGPWGHFMSWVKSIRISWNE